VCSRLTPLNRCAKLEVTAVIEMPGVTFAGNNCSLQTKMGSGAIMRAKTLNHTRILIPVCLAVWQLALAMAGYGQGAPAPSMGARLTLGMSVNADYVLNLDVRVRGADGSPFMGTAVVTLFAKSGLPISTATTRGNGALFAQLAPGQYYVEVEAPGYWKTREDAVVDPQVGHNVVTVSMVTATSGMAPVVYYHTPLLEPEVQKELQRGIALLKANKLDAAQKPLKSVLKKSPNHPAALYAMGLYTERKGNLQEARSYWEKAISFDPTQQATVYALGQSYLTEGNYSKADEMGRQLLLLEPNSWKAHSLLASTAFRQERYADAVSHAERAIELGREEAGSISIVLAQALAVQGNRETAIEALNRYIAAKPDASHKEIAEQLLSRIQSSTDRFVISGSTLEKAIADVPEPEESAPVEGWMPANIDEAIPAVEPGATCSLDDVVTRAGEQLERLPGILERFSATERIEHQALTEKGIASKAQTVSFAYVVSIRETRSGSLNVEEYRNGTDDPAAFPEHFATRGLPSQVFVFHPYYRDEFAMKCEGLARQENGFTWQIRFEQKENVPSRMQVHYLNGRRYPVPLKGRAWIDSSSYQVVRMETDLREAVKPAGLYAQHTDVQYGPVQFKKDKSELWLPIRADFFIQTKGHRVHRRHDFSDYVLFAVEDKQKISEPKSPSNLQ